MNVLLYLPYLTIQGHGDRTVLRGRAEVSNGGSRVEEGNEVIIARNGNSGT